MNTPADSNAKSHSKPQTDVEQTTIEIQQEISQLQQQLFAAQARLNLRLDLLESTPPLQATPTPVFSANHETLHSLLILSDSALPLGSFAFSSGLESYLAHTRSAFPSQTPLTKFHTFLELSLSSYAALTLPYVHAAYLDPSNLLLYDDTLDASTICTVARRASVAQGRALLGVWERSFCEIFSPSDHDPNVNTDTKTRTEILASLKEMSQLLRSSNTREPTLPQASAHFPPLFGALSRLLNLSQQATSYIYLLSHVKALLSAAVRASMFGPYMAQRILAGEEVKVGIKRAMLVNDGRKWDDARQVVPVLDLWVGRHEVLYSRIFNS